MPLSTEVGLGPDHILLDFQSVSVVTKRLDGSRSHLVWG